MHFLRLGGPLLNFLNLFKFKVETENALFYDARDRATIGFLSHRIMPTFFYRLNTRKSKNELL
jgi:hypothetical protein